jgi:hypothetical protein
MTVRPAKLGKLTAAMCLFLLGGGLSVGQEDSAKQKAIEQMRRIANAMKQCPAEKSSFQDECQVYTSHLGPPTNVEWDVVPSKSVRAPYLGIIEFTVPNRRERTDVANLPKKLQRKCADRKDAMASQELQIDAQAMREGPMWKDGHYRFEFDVGLSKPELVKMLWVVKDRNDKVITSPSKDSDACWIAKAKSGSTE